MLSAIYLAIIPVSSNSQTVVFGGDPHGQPKQNNPSSPMASNGPKSNNKNNNQKIWINGGWSYGPGYGGNGISVNMNSGYPYGAYYNPYNNYYGGYSMKKAARYSIRRSAGMLNQAINFQTWNDYYSPLLAKAIRHQQYARQLYWWGDYNGAYNHAERAAFLAWHVMNYYQPGYSGYYDDGFVDNEGYNPQPNPYSDPYNPYYRKNHTNSNNPESIDDDLSMKKQSSNNTTPNSQSTNANINKAPTPSQQNEEIDLKLPSVNISDQDLIKSIKAQDLNIE